MGGGFVDLHRQKKKKSFLGKGGRHCTGGLEKKPGQQKM